MAAVPTEQDAFVVPSGDARLWMHRAVCGCILNLLSEKVEKDSTHRIVESEGWVDR